MSDPFPRAPFDHVAAHMSGFPHPWAICGGWAVDAWLNRHSRPHGDFDIFVLEENERALFDHLSQSWALIAHDEAEPDATHAWSGRALVHPAHIHAMPSMEVMLAEWVPNGSDGPMPLDDRSLFRLEIMFNQRSGSSLQLIGKQAGGNRGDRLPAPQEVVSLPLQAAIRTNPLGLPSLVPEALIFLKATAYWSNPKYQARRPYDETDSASLLPIVPPPGRSWLREAIASIYPDHPWLTWEGLSHPN